MGLARAGIPRPARRCQRAALPDSTAARCSSVDRAGGLSVWLGPRRDTSAWPVDRVSAPMHLTSPPHPGPALARLLEDDAQALSGYPVRPLVQAWLAPGTSDDAGQDRTAGLLLRHVLVQWTAVLAHHLDLMAGGGGLAVEHVCQRTRASHDALQRLLTLVDQHLAAGAVDSDKPPRFTPALAVGPEPSRIGQRSIPTHSNALATQDPLRA